MGWKQAVLSAGVSSSSSKKRNIERLKNLTIEERRQLVLRYAKRSANKKKLVKCEMGTSRTNLLPKKSKDHGECDGDIEYLPVEVDKKTASLRGTFIIPTQTPSGEYEPISIISGYSQCTGATGSVPTMGVFQSAPSSTISREIFSAPTRSPSELHKVIQIHNNNTNQNKQKENISEDTILLPVIDSPRSSNEIPICTDNPYDIRKLPNGYTDGTIISTNSETQEEDNKNGTQSHVDNLKNTAEIIRPSAGYNMQEEEIEAKAQNSLNSSQLHKLQQQDNSERISKIKRAYLADSGKMTSKEEEKQTSQQLENEYTSTSTHIKSSHIDIKSENVKETKDEESEISYDENQASHKKAIFSSSFNDFTNVQAQEPKSRSSLKEILGDAPPPIPRRIRKESQTNPILTTDRPKSMSWTNVRDRNVSSDWSKNKPLQHFDSIKFEDLGSSDDENQEQILINEESETIGNWTDRFQTTLENLRSFNANTPLDQLIDGNAELLYLAQDFLHCAETYGRIIISERFLSPNNKTIKPISLGGVSGGEKYIVHHTLFKFAVDSYGILGSDYAAAKVAG